MNILFDWKQALLYSFFTIFFTIIAGFANLQMIFPFERSHVSVFDSQTNEKGCLTYIMLILSSLNFYADIQIV